MEVIECIKGRRSIRSYKEDEVSHKDIMVILESASMAPSNLNRQPWYFIVIKESSIKRKMAEAVERRLKEIINKIKLDPDKEGFMKYSKYFTFFERASVVIAVLYRRTTSPIVTFLERAGIEEEDKSYSDIQSVSAAIQNMILTAYSLGFGTCWMTNPLIAAEDIESLLKIEEPYHLLAIIPVGIPNSISHLHRKRDVGDIAKFIY